MAAQKQKEIATIHDGAVYIHVAGTPVYRKTADICTMTGKTNQWIGQLTSQGTITKRSTPYGQMYEDASTMHSYCTLLETRAKEAAEKAMSSEFRERNAADTSLKKSKAVKAGLEAKELMGKMHRIETIEIVDMEYYTAVRSALLALPGRLAVDIAPAMSPAEASKIINAEIKRVMYELANHEFKPEKYEAIVRERMNWDDIDVDDGVDDD